MELSGQPLILAMLSNSERVSASPVTNIGQYRQIRPWPSRHRAIERLDLVYSVKCTYSVCSILKYIKCKCKYISKVSIVVY